MTVNHELKTLPEHFEQVWESFKKNEVRLNDRDFQTGDFLTLREWNSESGYSKRELKCLVTHVLKGGQFGIDPNYSVLSLMILDRIILGTRETHKNSLS